jgi:septum formation protein
VRSADIDESLRGNESPREFVTRLAREKAQAVQTTDLEDSHGSFYIGADTVVVRDGEILGKPADSEAAQDMLRSLSGRAHHVITGFCVLHHTQVHVETVVTKVWFRSLVDAVIKRYVATGEPMDKAGSYGIQAGGGSFVSRIDGSYSNVVGLPVVETLRALAQLGGPKL